MGFFKKLFGIKGNSKVVQDNSLPKLSSVPISSIVGVPEGMVVVAESEVPESIGLGNLNFEGRYLEAIKAGEQMLEKNPTDNGVYINLMDSYFKARALDDSYFDKCTECARIAILYGHNTGYAHIRLIKNYTQTKHYHKALQLCELILSGDIHFSRMGCGNCEDFGKRKASILKKLPQAIDKEGDVAFTPEEVASIQKVVAQIEAKEEADRKANEERLRRMEKELGL